MDVLIRNININTVNKIDKLSKEGELSRNEFLCNKLEEIAFENEINELENKYQSLIENLSDITKEHIKILGAFMDEYIIDGKDAYNFNFNKKSDDILSLNTNLNYYSNEKSEIKIKNIPVDVAERISEIANERGISRNEFLNIYLRQLTYSSKLKLVDEKYNHMIEKTLGVIGFSNRVLEVFNDENIINVSKFYNKEQD
ncbi:MAG: hypothetical protein E6342_17670 [Clostridium sp.]|uniref:hypothetical protein n=1 Tax=Clostridium sp. TaxID=1506 RepID=UPI0029061B63|nr:hypothetical protein [Clostridium sp.]MDU4843976.1 hypothetical protein [Leclercia adecarboxylata]MDU7089518.1 hypothetical protein [Clostridium sp.]